MNFLQKFYIYNQSDDQKIKINNSIVQNDNLTSTSISFTSSSSLSKPLPSAPPEPSPFSPSELNKSSSLTSTTSVQMTFNQSKLIINQNPSGKMTNYTENNEKSEDKKNKYLLVLKSCWKMLLNTFLIYFVSLSIFPAVQARVKPLNHILPEKYFESVTCFLTFNLCGMIGNYLAQILPKVSPKRLWIYILLRFVFIPFTLFCNYNPEQRKLPVLIKSDIAYLSGNILMGLSFGYLSSLSIMYTPKCVDSHLQSTAGMMSALVIIVGILCGIYFALLYPSIVLI